jgi:hypothetical protein
MQSTRNYLPAIACVVLSSFAVSACAWGGRAATEISGTPSATGCDAWFASQGRFSRQNDIRFTLQNRSINPQCSATRVQYLFVTALRTERFKVAVPTGWTSRELRCPGAPGFCGFEWRANGVGVPAGQTLQGFGLSYLSVDAPNAKSWIIDVGRRRVEMPIGNVGGEASKPNRPTG